MGFASIALWAASLTAQVQPDKAPEYHLVDMVVAQVDATVITLSTLVAETRLVLLQTGGPEVARAAYLSQGLLNTVLKSLVQRELLLGEVRRLKLRDVPSEEVVKSIDDIKRAFATAADYQRFLEKSGFVEAGAELQKGYDAPPRLVASVLAQLEMVHLLELRVHRAAPVRESDIELCYQANRERFERPLEDMKKIIAERIAEQEQERATQALIDQLARRATIRYADKFEPPPDAPNQGVAFSCPERKAESASP